MKSLAFIDHSFHKASRSTDFLREIFSREYIVTMFFDEAWRGGPAVDIGTINAGDFDVVVFFQVLPAPFSLLRLTCMNLIWVPMFDSDFGRADSAWRALRAMNIKVLCFSGAMFEAARKSGVRSHYVQYFPEIPPQQVCYDAPRLFFWQRTDFLTWQSVGQVLAGSRIEKAVLRDDPDPDHSFAEPSRDDIARFNIEIVRNMKIAGGRREDYLKTLFQCNIFVAPRLREGIGLSFLEAMAMGMCVIGVDLPTLNEYIQAGQNGYLFDPEQPATIDIAGFARCGLSARESAAAGRKKWLDGISPMMDFVAARAAERSPIAITSVLLWAAGSAIRRRYEQTFRSRDA